MTTTKNLVLLEELGFEMGGGNTETAMARLPGRSKAVTDWQGRLCVSSEIAAKMLAAYQDEVAEAATRVANYEAYVRSREEARQAAGELAAEEAKLAYYQATQREIASSFAGFTGGANLRGGPAELAAGSAARRQAVAEFDRRHPLEPIEEWAD